MRQEPARAPRTLQIVRSRPRAGIAALAVLAVALVPGLAAVPASAAPAPAPAPARAPAPRVKVVPGDRTLSAVWSRVADADSYTVRIGRSRSLASARTITTTRPSIRFGELRNGVRYWIDVTAKRDALSTASVRSGPVRATAAQGVPFPVQRVTVEPGDEAHQLRVTWTGGGRARKVAVVAGSNVRTTARSFNSGWYPATTRSITITVPEEHRSVIGAGTGNPVWVKVVQSNSGSKEFGASYSSERRYRPSETGTWGFARAVTPAAEVTKLRVAAYNIQSLGASARHTRDNQWSARAPRVANAVNEADPDLMLTGELSTSLVQNCTNSVARNTFCTAHAQYMHLDRLVPGLQVAGADAYPRVIEMMRRHTNWTGKATNGAHVFYDPSKLTLLDHGFLSPALRPEQSFGNVVGLGVGNWTGSGPVGPDRWLSWAKLETTDAAKRRFVAVAAHFPTGTAPVVFTVREELAHKALAAVKTIAGDLPVVLGGDLNADPARTRGAPHTVFMRDGWFDAGAVPDKRLRKGMRVSTANGSGGGQDGADPGYPTKPVVRPYETSRIDFILLKGSPYTFKYRNVLHMKKGRFDRSMTGSDHNMQLATIGIASPPAPPAPAPPALAPAPVPVVPDVVPGVVPVPAL